MPRQTQRGANADAAGAYRRRSVLLTGIILGIGIIGFIDEAVLHQILQWHTFYWATSEYGRILSDGFFHIFSTLVLLWGAFRLWQASKAWTPGSGQELSAAILIGGGGFNTFDGVVDHLVLHVHLVNERVCALVDANNTVGTCPQDIPYEIVFTAIGLGLLIGGMLWWQRTATQNTRPGRASKRTAVDQHASRPMARRAD